ncbi:MAG: PHP domain-containing protein [Methanosarcina flavescens]
MKTWTKYRNYLLKGEWHVHSNYTDGMCSIKDYCQRAVEVGLPLIAFTEHVRKNLDYDFSSFLNDIEIAKEEFDIVILSGCEAKVLPSGDLDVSEDVLKQVDYPIFAYHSFPIDIDLVLTSLKKVLKNKYVNAWAHPGAFLKKNNLQLPEEDLIEIFHLVKRMDVLLEVNNKYKVPSSTWMSLAEKVGVEFVRGSDVHNITSIKHDLYII